jgi:nitric oxide reductase activation protein
VLKNSNSKRTDDDIMRRGIAGKVSFKDIRTTRVTPNPLSAEDARAVQRLRELFRRVHTRKVKQRYESGSEVDIETVIYNRVNNLNEPCFKDEGSGRGFKVMLLVDRSGSMSGPRSVEAERACRMLRKALKQPNVDTVVWGFSGGTSGETALTRVAPNLDISESREMPCQGNTPMGQAIRVATNYLAQGTQKKHLFVITDGMPNASTNVQKLGRSSSATDAVAEEVERARKMGIHVTALTIGVGINEKEMKDMFGSERSWAIAPRTEDLTPKLLKAATTSFVQFLKRG